MNFKEFTNYELDILSQYNFPTKDETLSELIQIVPIIKHAPTRVMIESTIFKVEKLSESDYKFLAGAIGQFNLSERDNDIIQHQLAANNQNGDILAENDSCFDMEE